MNKTLSAAPVNAFAVRLNIFANFMLRDSI